MGQAEGGRQRGSGAGRGEPARVGECRRVTTRAVSLLPVLLLSRLATGRSLHRVQSPRRGRGAFPAEPPPVPPRPAIPQPPRPPPPRPAPPPPPWAPAPRRTPGPAPSPPSPASGRHPTTPPQAWKLRPPARRPPACGPARGVDRRPGPGMAHPRLRG